MIENTTHKEILMGLLRSQKYYIVINTKFTINHIEKLSGSVRDRGRWKWISENNLDYYKSLTIPEAQRSHIDNGDLFPRLYFNNECLVTEFFSWLSVRELTITDITTPKI
jgi:hypothetical protein